MNEKNYPLQIDKLEEEIQELEKQSTDIAIIKNSVKIKEISNKLTSKQKELAILQKLHSIEQQLDDSYKLEKTEKDEEMKKMVKEEIQTLLEDKDEIEIELKELINPSSTKNVKDCIIEIRAGTGGEESNLFAADLLRMYSQYAQSRKWKVQMLSKNETGAGGFKEIISQFSGDKVFDKLQFESGVHRVQRVPVTESSGRIHTSAVSVVVFPLLEEAAINIDPSDLKIDVYRSSGPGGQSVNTTDSAVRITHIPTGIIATCQDEKSQHKNKKKALSILSAKLSDLETQKQQEEISEVRKSAIKTGDRSAKIRTYNFPQNRVTDHRIKKSWHNLKAILDGELDQIIETLEKEV